mmetsp:Transcript_15493/g.26240  ORF Transcript_15493/g.26240 Transcript_15493/m.26240 type:complete len:251 (-) Transcript_15493:32-784(-)
MKINANFKLFAATNFDATKYVASPAYGVNRFMLDRIGSEKARATSIVQYQPNSKFPEHTHMGGEEFLVLEGTFKDQFGEFPAGTYVRNPINSKHAPWVDDDGCTIMVKLLQMADTETTTQPLHVHFDNDHKDTNDTEFGKILQMYHNDQTGERVEMCWLNENATFPSNDDAQNGGEELFVVHGSLCLDNEVYDKWGWIRFPPNNDDNNNADTPTKRSLLRAGNMGAKVYRKTGHLSEKALAMEKIQITED